MKTLVLTVMALVFASGSAFAAAASNRDVCEKAVTKYAVEKQKEDYKTKAQKKEDPQNPEATLSEEKKNGYELWDVVYTVNEECLEGYQVLVRRAANGKTCEVLKETTDTQRDCG